MYSDCSPSQREVETRPTQYSNHFKIPQLTANAWLTAEQIEAMASIGASAIIIHGTGLGHLPIDNPQKMLPKMMNYGGLFTDVQIERSNYNHKSVH